MTLSPMQLGRATRRLKQGWPLREIAAELDLAFEDVCLALYGDNDWRKPDGDVDEADGRAGGHGGVGVDAAGDATATIAGAGHPDVDAVGGAGAAEAAPAARAAEPEAAPAPVAEPQPQGRAADAAQVVVDARAGAPVLAARPRAAAAALDPAKIYRLVEFDGQTLHQNRRSLTRLPQFFWRGTGEAVVRLKRSMPQWQDLEPVETDIRPEGAR